MLSLLTTLRGRSLFNKMGSFCLLDRVLSSGPTVLIRQSKVVFIIKTSVASTRMLVLSLGD